MAPEKQVPVQNGGFAHEHFVVIQRARMLSALVDVVTERGAANASVARIVERSGVSRRTFYELFRDRDDCFLAAFDEGVASLAEPVLPAFGRPGRWREKVRAGLVALLAAFDDEPDVARLLVAESLAAGRAAVERRRRVVGELIAVVDRGRRETEAGSALPSVTAEGVVGGALAVVHSRLLERVSGGFVEGRSGGLIDLVGPLMSMIVLPYLGPAAARRELERPISRAPARRHPVNSDPLRGLRMRLTYRTMRVLAAVAEHPASSNRALGELSGVSDQGQISKLLARLQKLGLIEQRGAGPSRGEPNAWVLTGKGGELHGAIAYQTTRS
jgi:AcrR family transcriptional regulator